ncbi:MAG TPA: glycosyltransferase family 1 protein [Bryobacteraceae bacterium]|nr:glycosyltransferase family 1 protein [Bryobacteraceae bacterium]
MRVVIEAASLSLSSGGLARYTSELSLALARCYPDDTFFLVSDQPFEMPRGAPANLQSGGGPRTAVERKWWLWGLGREAARLGADVVHGPDFAVPYLPRHPSVLTLHDLSPWMDRGWHHAAGRVRRRTPVLLEWGVGTMVITPGERVRKQAMERFRLDPDRVVAVPEAAAPWLKRVERQTARPYFLFVGTIEPRKNLPALVEAWREVRREHPVDLVLAGRRRPDGPELRAEPGLQLAGEVADEELAALYSGALAFVYPSHYEGFGLPVLEAMQCGACVIASRAVQEAAGDAAVYAEGERELAEAMRQAIDRPDWVAEQQARSLARAGEFSWERTARLSYQVYREARKRFAN